MIKEYAEGMIIWNNLKEKFNCEIELDCINSEFLEKHIFKKELEKAKNLFEKYPDRVILKESEFHTKESPYYELSLFCDKLEVDQWKKELEDLDIRIDIIHDED